MDAKIKWISSIGISSTTFVKMEFVESFFQLVSSNDIVVLLHFIMSVRSFLQNSVLTFTGSNKTRAQRMSKSYLKSS